MTLDKAIKDMETIAEENQRVVDTGIVFKDVTIDMLYCDDTEVIEEHLANYQRCAEEHRQLAEWLKDYKRLLGQELKTGHWIELPTHESQSGLSWYECSECNSERCIAVLRDFKYCPSCGAKME